MKQLVRPTELHALAVYIAEAIKPDIIQAVMDCIKSNREIMMPSEVAKMFDTSTAAIYKRCQRNQLPFHKDAMGHYFFYKDEIIHSLSIGTSEEGHL